MTGLSGDSDKIALPFVKFVLFVVENSSIGRSVRWAADDQSDSWRTRKQTIVVESGLEV